MSTGSAQEELQALELGIELRNLDKSTGMPWACNVVYGNGRYATRGGFGTLAQYGTTLTGGRDTLPGADSAYGYRELLGCHVCTTQEGHRQILSVHKVYGFSGDAQTSALPTGAWIVQARGQYLLCFALNVYDVTTDKRVEFILHSDTQEQININLNTVRPHYQQLGNGDAPDWVAGNDADTACFTDLNGNVICTVVGVGTWIYRPCCPLLDRRKMLHIGDDYDVDNIGSRSYGEESAVQRLMLGNGEDSVHYVYKTDSTMPPAVATCNYQNCLVIASGRTVYYSDPDQPSHVMALNFNQLPSEYEIVAVGTCLDNIKIFTKSETWTYRPSADTLLSGGSLYCESRDIGCIGPRHIVQGDDALYWLDRNGVYRARGGVGIARISAPIDPWFSQAEQMQNPATSFQVASGVTGLAQDQPRARIDLVAQLVGGNVTWDQSQRRLLCTAKDLTLTWTEEGGWLVWLYETTCQVIETAGPVGPIYTPQVGIEQNILNPMLLADEGEIYLVGGFDESFYLDYSILPHQSGVLDRSYYILQLGKGGTLDRSSAQQENHRTPNGSWFRELSLQGPAAFYIGKPVGPMPIGYRTARQVTDEEIWLIPVYLKGASNTFQWRLHFRIDLGHWQALIVPAGGPGEIDFILPAERLHSVEGYLPAAMTPINEVRAYLFGAPNDNGNEIHIAWRGFNAAATWVHWPWMNCNGNFTNPIIYIPVKRHLGATAAESVLSIVTDVLLTDYNGQQQVVPADAWLWREAPNSQPEQSLADDAIAQPLDWSLKTRAIGDGKNQLKCRGTYAKMQSLGSAITKKIAGWIWGPHNTITTSDYRDFSAQTSDFTSEPPGVHGISWVDSMRARFRPATAVVPTLKVGAGLARWGDSTDPRQGNFIIDDPAVDTIATSEGVRGEQFSTMMFGCLNHPAESVKVSEVCIMVRVIGSRRRTGR